mgnify:CR=1 FL=1|tara:strand:- start:505 stop:801 length:297 start_codon:yes stop_codon:yes gene_type:complete
MASLYFGGEKAEKSDAKKNLMQHAASVFDGRFTVCFDSDDGGNHIVLVLEVADPSDNLDPFLTQTLHSAKWMGWRYIILKVPAGYIDAILEAPKRDDY